MRRGLGITRVNGAKVSWLFVFFCTLEALAWFQATWTTQNASFLKHKSQFATTNGRINVEISAQVNLIVEALQKLQSDLQFLVDTSPLESSQDPATTTRTARNHLTSAELLAEFLLENQSQNPRKASVSPVCNTHCLIY